MFNEEKNEIIYQSGVLRLENGAKPRQKTEKKSYSCFTCKFDTNDKKDYTRHLETKKHIKKEEERVEFEKQQIQQIQPKKKLSKKIDVKIPKTEEKSYYCFTCEFATDNKKDYNRHLESKKHINNEETEKKEMEARRLEKIQKEQSIHDAIFWKRKPVKCRNGCEYQFGDRFHDTDGIAKMDWLCAKCDDEECDRLFGVSKKPTIQNVIIA
jgi:hypothetical protein